MSQARGHSVSSDQQVALFIDSTRCIILSIALLAPENKEKLPQGKDRTETEGLLVSLSPNVEKARSYQTSTIPTPYHKRKNSPKISKNCQKCRHSQTYAIELLRSDAKRCKWKTNTNLLKQVLYIIMQASSQLP